LGIVEDTKALVEDAKKAASELTTGTVVPNCDVFRLSYLLGDVAEARAAAAIIVKIWEENPEIKQLWKDAVKAHEDGYRARDRFTAECLCKKK